MLTDVLSLIFLSVFTHLFKQSDDAPLFYTSLHFVYRAGQFKTEGTMGQERMPGVERRKGTF